MKNLEAICQRIEALLPGSIAVSAIEGPDGSGPMIDVFNAWDGTKSDYENYLAATDSLGADRFAVTIISHHREATALYYAETVAEILAERQREQRMTECLERFIGAA